MVNASNVKNGKIEFYRFIFCLAVLFFHIEKYLMGEPELGGNIHFSLFAHGSLGVEFFFLTSGFFMARSAKRLLNQSTILNNEQKANAYAGFIFHKYRRIFVPHAVAFVITFATHSIVMELSEKEIFVDAIQNIPSFFLLQMTGMGSNNVNHVEWYLSAMLIAMVILFPLLLNHYYSFLRYWGPFIAIIGLGCLQYITGALTGVMIWTAITYKSVLRAIFEIILGGTCFEVSEWMRARGARADKKTIKILTFIEMFVFVLSVVCMMTTWERTYEIYVLAMIMIVIILSGSEITGLKNLFNNKVCYFLGDISLAIYLSQLTAIYIVSNKCTGMTIPSQCIICAIITFLVALFVWASDKSFQKIKKMRTKA